MSILLIAKIFLLISGIIEIIFGIIVIALATSVSKKNRKENDRIYLEYINEQKDKGDDKC